MYALYPAKPSPSIVSNNYIVLNSKLVGQHVSLKPPTKSPVPVQNSATLYKSLRLFLLCHTLPQAPSKALIYTRYRLSSYIPAASSSDRR
jgi:hypothetical protein